MIKKRGVYEILKKIINSMKIGWFLVIVKFCLFIERFKRVVCSFNEKKML